MSKWILRLFAAATLAAVPAAGGATQAPARPQAGAKAAAREPHPRIRGAITALQRAKSDLQHASHDFGGHRADALAAVDKAIEQLQLALQYDKK
jgi:hypothetical protein